MDRPEKCAFCNNAVIGFQGFGCGAAFVCADHADPVLLGLRPGERKISGDCVFERYR